MAGRAGEEVDVVDAARDVELRGQPHRLAGLADLLGDEVVGVGVGQFGELGEHRRALGGGRRRPAGQRRARRRDGAVDVGGGGQRHLGDGAPLAGIDHLVQPPPVTTGRSVDPAACHVGGHGLGEDTVMRQR